MPLIEKVYRILDAGFVLKADCQEFLDRFDQDFALFAVSTEESSKTPLLTLEFENKIGGSIGIRRDGAPFEEVREADLPFLYHIIRKEIFRTLPHFFFFHGGVSVQKGQALIISGPPDSGKTTLTIEFVRTGFEFFSDEVCPIERTTDLVHPFPRTLWVSPKNEQRSAKTPLSPQNLGRPGGDQAARPRCLIIIDPVSDENSLPELKIHIRQDRIDILVRRLAVDGVRIERIVDSVYGEVMVPFGGSPEMKRRLIQAVNESRDMILEVGVSRPAKPDFSRTPTISKLTPSSAARLWIGHLIDRSNPLFVDQSGSVLFQATRILKNVLSYRLVPGDLEQTKTLIRAAWEAAEAE